eukprot:113452_1
MAHEVGSDQYLPDDMNETMGFDNPTDNGMNGHTQGGYGQQQQQKPTSGGGVVMQDSTDLSETQKLQLAERANEIYRQQLKYMQDHLASLRSLIQDKENIIENLMLRYDLGIITQDSNRQGGNLGPDEIEMEELRRKAEALAQRTILENFELREMVNELRDENFHLRNEIYELQDKINRQVLQINKLEKTAQQSQISNAQVADMIEDDRMEDADMNMYGDDDDDNDNDIYDVEEDEEMNDNGIYDDEQQNNTMSHGRGQSITGADWLNNDDRLTGRRESRTMNHPANSEEAIAKRLDRKKKHVRKESEKPPNLFGTGDSNSDEDDDEYMDDEALAKREARANKSRKESIATPDIYGDAQGESEEDEGSDDDDDNKQEAPQTGTKRRGSQIYMDNDALIKRQQRQAKSHRRDSSVATPDIFRQNYDPVKVARDKVQQYTPEAQMKRLKRKAKKVGAAAVKHVKSHRRKESLAEKLLLGPMEDEFDIKSADPEQRKELEAKARKEQRRKSRQLIKSQVGAKEHFSDDDVDLQEEKPQRTAHKARKKMKSSQRKTKDQGVGDMDNFEDIMNKEMNKEMANYTTTNNKKRNSIKADPPIISMDDDGKKGKGKHHRRDSSAPVVSLGFEDPDVLLHYEKLKVQDLEKELENRLNELDNIKSERDNLATRMNSTTDTVQTALEKSEQAEIQLQEAVHSKAALAQKCAMEIMRLTMILNTLQQMPKFKEIVQLLMDESNKDNN